MNKIILSAYILFNLFLCIYSSLDSQSNSNILLQKWKNVTKLVSINETIQAFRYLKKNIKATVIAEMVKKGGCKYKLEPARFAIVENNVYSYGSMKNHLRVTITQNYLKSITAKTTLPDMYFVLHFYDELIPQTTDKKTFFQCRSLPLFLFNKNGSAPLEKTKFLLPDPFVMDKWQEPIDEVKKASQTYKWEDKISKLFFRGIPSAPHFFDMVITNKTNMQKYFHRAAYIILSMDHPDLIDAKFTKFKGQITRQVERRVGENRSKQIWAPEVSLTEHMKYKYLLSADGTGASWKRVPFILYSNSVLFKPFSEKMQWFYDKLIPNTHFVSINDDLSNLFTEMESMNKNDTKAKQMSKQANEMAEKYLSVEAIEQYTIETLKTYASLQQLSLNQEEKKKVKNKIDINTVLIEKRKKEQSQMDIVLEEKWKDSLKLISFEETIQAFPIIKENLNISKMMKIIEEGGCGITLGYYLIMDNKVYITGGFKENQRAVDFGNHLRKVIQRFGLPDMFFMINLQDQLILSKTPAQFHQLCTKVPLFMFNKNSSSFLEQSKFLIPDAFIVKKWDQSIKNIQQYNTKNKWQNKLKKAYFVGLGSSTSYHEAKINSQTDFYKYDHGAGLVMLSQERPDLIEAKVTTEGLWEMGKLQDELQRRDGKGYQNGIGVPFESTHHKYRYLLTADGFGAPWKQTPSILFSNSLLLKPFSQKLQWFYDKMIPNVHYIQINQDLSDLFSKIEQMNINDKKAKEIITKANIFAKNYLMPQAIQQQTFETLKKYSDIQKLQIDKQSKQKIVEGKDIFEVLKGLRGFQQDVAIKIASDNTQNITLRTEKKMEPKKQDNAEKIQLLNSSQLYISSQLSSSKSEQSTPIANLSKITNQQSKIQKNQIKSSNNIQSPEQKVFIRYFSIIALVTSIFAAVIYLLVKCLIKNSPTKKRLEKSNFQSLPPSSNKSQITNYQQQPQRIQTTNKQIVQ